VAFARWDPFHDLLSLQERLDRLAGDSTGWAPPIDLFETADRYQVIVEVPGVRRDQIQIRVQNSTLTLEGERSAPAARCEQYHCVERGHGRFSRSFRLRETIDADAITAELRDGVLTICLPKTRAAAQRIDVG
jgi:HSP20 family protein